MTKTTAAKAFNAWKRVKEVLQEAENWLVYANNLIATKPENETRWERKEVRKEEKRIEELKAKLVALYTDEVKAEIAARENFKKTFAEFIEKWAERWTQEDEKHCSGVFDYEKTLARNKYDVTLQLYSTNNRIFDAVGTLVELTNVFWGPKGLEGIVTGTDGRAYIHTIEAGGYNIQRWHLRVLVNKLPN